MAALKKILVPIDGSEPSLRAVEHASMIAKATGASLDLVTVLDLRQVDVYEGFYLTDEQLEKIEEHAHERVLDVAKKKVPEGVKVQTRLLKGPALKLLLHEAEAGADLVVIGRTGKNALERVLEGSVSRGLAAHCKVPITIVA